MATDLLDLARRQSDPEIRLKLVRAWQHQNEIDALRRRIAECARCGLHRTRTRAVPWSGPTSARVAVVGEGPGWQEDRDGVPFVGKAGRLLDRFLAEELGIDRSDVFTCNTVACRAFDPQTKRDRAPIDLELEACRPHLDAQLGLTQAPVVILLGATALKSFWPTLRVSKDHGRIHAGGGRWWLVTFHPSAALRDPGRLEEMRRDFRTFRAFLDRFPWRETDRDPRPDLGEDSESWTLLLTALRVGESSQAWSQWHGLRCAGARLVTLADGGLAPDLDPLVRPEAHGEGGHPWEPRELYGWVQPHRPAFERAARTVRSWVNPEF